MLNLYNHTANLKQTVNKIDNKLCLSVSFFTNVTTVESRIVIADKRWKMFVGKQ